MKNIKEEIRKRNTFRKFQHHVLYQKGFEDGVAFAHSWISVEKEIPRIGLPVLLKDLDGNIHIGERNGLKKFVLNTDPSLVNCRTITHWREIEIT